VLNKADEESVLLDEESIDQTKHIATEYVFVNL